MSAPAVARTRAELADLLAPARAEQRPVALVPTMGALHEGHAVCFRTARKQVDGPVVASIFVNPMQFGPGEDLDRYPRTFDEDLRICAEEGVDVVFAPSVEEVYPGGEPEVTIEPGPLATELEGRSRPGHFRGVLTVVAKLFGLVRPDVAVFGEKDYQQLVLLRRMVADLCLTIDIVGAETAREDDGLAMSSRNRYLDSHTRHEAVALNLALLRAREYAHEGVDSALAAARAELRQAHGVDLEYLELRTDGLSPLPDVVPDGFRARILIAARVRGTRLIDNMPITFGADSTGPDPTDRAGGYDSTNERSS